MTDSLIDLPDNPIPENTETGIFRSREGLKLRYARFPAISTPLKGTVVILHGRNECVEKYFETAADLTRRGFAVATFDWRGQGGSQRLVGDPHRGYVDSYHDYVSDLDCFFRDIVLPDCRGPYFILGHSTGSLVALLATPALANRVNRMVLSAPLLGLATLPSSEHVVHTIASFFYSIGLGRIYMGGGPRPAEAKPFENNVLTSDRDRYQRNAHLFESAPHLALGGATAAWLNATFNAIAQVRKQEFAAAIHIPVLMVAAGADTVVSNRAIERQARKLRAGTLLTIDGARHEILQEANIYREQFLAAFDAFVPGDET